jgi:hypothetical protein
VYVFGVLTSNTRYSRTVIDRLLCFTHTVMDRFNSYIYIYIYMYSHVFWYRYSCIVVYMYALHKFIFIHTYVFGVFASNVDYLPGIHALDPFVFYILGHGPFQYIYLFTFVFVSIFVYMCMYALRIFIFIQTSHSEACACSY